MIKTIFLFSNIFIFSFLIQQNSNAQDLQEFSYEYDIPLSVTDIHELDDGFLLTGLASPNVFDSTISLLIKTDANFNPVWTKRYKLLFVDDFTTITPTNDGNFLIGGAARQEFNPLNGAQVYKVDSDGNLIWGKVYSESSGYRILEIFEQSDNTLMIFIRHGVSGQPTKILHTDELGNIISDRIYEVEGTGVFAESVISDGNGDYYLSGAVHDSIQGIFIPFLCAINSTDMLWYKQYNLPRTSNTYSLTIMPDNGFTMLGNIILSEGSLVQNSFIARLNELGEVINMREYAISEESIFCNEIILTDSGLSVVGKSNDFDFVYGMVHSISEDLSAINSSYKYQFGITTAIDQAELLSDNRLFMIGVNFDGNFLVVSSGTGVSSCTSEPMNFSGFELDGSSFSLSPEVDTTSVIANSVSPEIIELDISKTLICSGTNIEDHELIQNINISPVPFSNIINVETNFDPNSLIEYSLKDLSGKIIEESKNESSIFVIRNLELVAPGLYIIKVTDGHLWYSYKLIK